MNATQQVSYYRPKPWQLLQGNKSIDLSTVPLNQVAEHPSLSWKVTKAPIVNQTTGLVIPSARATTRSDTGRTLGIVGTSYEVIQLSEVFTFVNDTFAGQASFESAVLLDEGAEFVGVLKLNREITIGGEPIDPYFLVRTSFDGKTSLQLISTPMRPFCTNQVALLTKTSKRVIRIQHSSKYLDRMEEAKRTLNLVSGYYDAFERQAEALLAKTFSPAEFEKLVKSLVPLDDSATQRVQTNVKETQSKMIRCFSADDLANLGNNGWKAYNAVADYSDHHTRFNGTDASERQFSNALLNTSLKDEALQLILAA